MATLPLVPSPLRSKKTCSRNNIYAVCPHVFTALIASGLVLSAAPLTYGAEAEHQHEHAPLVPPAPVEKAGAMPGMDHSQMDHVSMEEDGAGRAMEMSSALGTYPMTREASGTSWQPDASTHSGQHFMWGDWMAMSHATINGTYDWQGGPRGDKKTFASGMIMGMARRTLTEGDIVNFSVMLSPDPIMGKRGYPLLLASGETADGTTTLVDRQHPHDLFMEMSASYSHPFSENTSWFVYLGLPGEPAFGPPAFMHRASIMDSPEAPISHHWLDSTHITFGVATGGLIYRNWKVEFSQFTGREPNANRYDLDHPRFDSMSARVSWNPTEHMALQASWAHLHSPEQLHPNENERRWSASAIYTLPLWQTGQWSTTFAWGQKSLSDGLKLDAWVLESALKPTSVWTLFARAERVDAAELQISTSAHGAAETVSKASAGVIRDFPLAEHASVGIGGLYAFNFPSVGLKASYGGSKNGAMMFVRIKVN
jgi:hypothetical protein